jgi:predicted short-subunit dehydrogenase-like oxidoreductase (DUF2520 family)
MKRSCAIVGCGKVGNTLARLVERAGFSLAGLASKSLSSAQQTAEKTHCENASTTPWAVTPDADLVFITTPDGKIEETCRQIAENNGFKKNAVVLHCSGSLPSTILSAAKSNQAIIGSMHPLQSFAAVGDTENPFEGIVVAVEGEEAAVQTARAIGEALGGNCLDIKTEAKMLYHASAVVASNYFVTVQNLAVQLITSAGISEADAFTVLGPLVRGTLANIEKTGTIKALTGPIARGDVSTVEAHVGAIKAQKPDLLQLYQTLGQYTIPIARAAGGLSQEAGEQLSGILSG